MKIFVKTPTGKTIELDVEPNWTVAQLEQKLKRDYPNEFKAMLRIED